MENPGEELAGSYLSKVLGCSFVAFNLDTGEKQGEMDVVGINLDTNTVYFCEVAIHLLGLQYVDPKIARPDNVGRFLKKFENSISYAKKKFPNYNHVFMLWSPIVRKSRDTSINNQMRDIKDIQDEIKQKHNIDLEIIINEKFLECISKLRNVAKKETKEIKTPIMRFLQIEERLKMHVEKLNKS